MAHTHPRTCSEFLLDFYKSSSDLHNQLLKCMDCKPAICIFKNWLIQRIALTLVSIDSCTQVKLTIHLYLFHTQIVFQGELSRTAESIHQKTASLKKTSKTKTTTTTKYINWKNKSKLHLKKKKDVSGTYTNGTKPYRDSPEWCCTLNDIQVFFHLKNNISQVCVSKIPNHILTTVLCCITCIISLFCHIHLK